jgi:hypothetical protein
MSVSAIVAAALAQHSVHWTADDTEDSEGTKHWTADVNADSGMARVSWYFEESGGKLHLVYVNKIFYVRGDSDSLEFFLALTNAQARRYAGRWISTSNGGDLLIQPVNGLTLSAAVREWNSADHRTHTRGGPLPLEFAERVAPDEAIGGSFSKWNEPVHVQAPARSVPIAIVQGG